MTDQRTSTGTEGLLPCPFCGGEASRSVGLKGKSPWAYIECLECASMADPEIWNARIPAQHMPGRDQVIRAIEGRMVSFQGYSSPMLAADLADTIRALALPSTDQAAP